MTIYTTDLSNIKESSGKGSGWVIDSAIDHNINISKYNLLAGNSYITLPKKLYQPRKGWINIQNIDDNKCFKWCSVRYLDVADHNPRRITKTDKDFAKNLAFKDIKFPVKVRDIHKIEKNNSIRVFGYENKEKLPIYVPKNFCEEKHVDFFLIGEDAKRHYVLIKDFNTFTYNHTLHLGKKHFCRC